MKTREIEYRINYIDSRGAHCMRTVADAGEAESQLKRLMRRGCLADVYAYDAGRRDDEYGRLGGVEFLDDRLIWWCENEFSN